jgi:hypothetical protein
MCRFRKMANFESYKHFLTLSQELTCQYLKKMPFLKVTGNTIYIRNAGLSDILLAISMI